MSGSESETDDEHVRGCDDNCGGIMDGEQEAQDDNEDYEKSFVNSDGNSQASHISAEPAYVYVPATHSPLFSPSQIPVSSQNRQSQVLLGDVMRTPENCGSSASKDAISEVLALLCASNIPP